MRHRDPLYHYQDTLIQKNLYSIIKPTFKHILSPACHHVKGPGVIKKLTHDITNALGSSHYRYCILN